MDYFGCNYSPIDDELFVYQNVSTDHCRWLIAHIYGNIFLRTDFVIFDSLTTNVVLSNEICWNALIGLTCYKCVIPAKHGSVGFHWITCVLNWSQNHFICWHNYYKCLFRQSWQQYLAQEINNEFFKNYNCSLKMSHLVPVCC